MAIQGSLDSLSLPDLFSLICQLRKTGVLHLVSRTEERSFLFMEGNLAYATTRDEKRRLGSFLVRLGFLKSEEVDDVFDLAPGDEPYFGRRLVSTGRLQREQLDEAVRAQIMDLVREVLTWKEGVFLFDDTPPPFDSEDEHLISTQSVIFEAARMTDEHGFAEKLFPDSSIVLVRTPECEKGSWKPDVLELLLLVDGKHSVDQIYSRSPKGPKATASLLKELLDTGSLEVDSSPKCEVATTALPELHSFTVSPDVPGLLYSSLARGAADSRLIAEVLKREPLLAAKVLRILTLSNVALDSDSLEMPRLVEALGEFQAHNLLFPEAARGLQYATDDHFWQDLWDHSRVCAQMSKFLATQTGYPYPGEAYLAGLLHNIGAYILLSRDAVTFREVVSESARTRQDVEELERERFGITRSQVGGLYAEKWRFPRQVVHVVQNANRRDASTKEPIMPLLCVARGLSQASGLRIGYHKNLGILFEESLRKLKLDRRQTTLLFQQISRSQGALEVKEEPIAV